MNKTALITGGSRGLGKDCALKLAAKGSNVILTYHTKSDEANAVVSEIRAMGVQAEALQFDVSNLISFDAFLGQVREILQQWGTDKFDFLVNNAGVGATIRK